MDSDTKSIAILESYFKNRKRTDRAKWLINIPFSKNVSFNAFTENLKKSFNNLILDLDDDIYFYHSNTDQSIDITEGYKISEEFEISVQKIGSWSEICGLKISEPNKAWRRKNLQGKNFILGADNLGDYVILLSENLISGFYGDILESIKVRYQNIFFVNHQSD